MPHEFSAFKGGTVEDVFSALAAGGLSENVARDWLILIYHGQGFSLENATNLAGEILQDAKEPGGPLFGVEETGAIQLDVADPSGGEDGDVPLDLIPVRTTERIPDPIEEDPDMTTDLADFLRDPAFAQTFFNEELGIPLRGRTRYQRFLADQFGDVLTSFGLRQAPELGGATELPAGTLPQTFRQFVRNRPGSLRQLGLGGIVGQFGGLSGEAQRSALGSLGGDEEAQDAFLQQLGQAELRQRVSPFIASRLAAREFGPAARRAFERQTAGEEPAPSFFDFVRGRLNAA